MSDEATTTIPSDFDFDGANEGDTQLHRREVTLSLSETSAPISERTNALIDNALDRIEFRSERTLNDKFSQRLREFGIDAAIVDAFEQNFEYEKAGFVSSGKTPEELRRIGLEADAFSIQVEIEEIEELLEETKASARDDEKEFMRRRIQKLRETLERIELSKRGVDFRKKEKVS